MAFTDKDNDKDKDSDRTTPESELHELSDGEYERERLENIKYVNPPTFYLTSVLPRRIIGGEREMKSAKKLKLL